MGEAPSDGFPGAVIARPGCQPARCDGGKRTAVILGAARADMRFRRARFEFEDGDPGAEGRSVGLEGFLPARLRTGNDLFRGMIRVCVVQSSLHLPTHSSARPANAAKAVSAPSQSDQTSTPRLCCRFCIASAVQSTPPGQPIGLPCRLMALSVPLPDPLR